jgi:hypothetical protein
MPITRISITEFFNTQFAFVFTRQLLTEVKEKDGVVWTGLISLRIGTSGVFL